MTTSTLDQQLRDARHVVVFTGAGASAESGIPTFRDALTGLWERFDPAQLATSEAFRADPALCWGWYEWRRNKVIQAQPNGAHYAIAELTRYVPKLTVVTQNVDDLHERAGSQHVIHLHGSLHSPRCIDCGLAYVFPLTSDVLPESGSRIEPPLCVACSGYIRPGVVWFGEMLPKDAWSADSQLQRAAICFSRLVRLGLFTRLLSSRYVLWVTERLSFTSILCASISAVRSTFSKALPPS